jgi:alginate production protein
VQRFQGYGELLDPELSNIQVFTSGFGCNLLENRSVDLFFHDYRLVERVEELRDARIESTLTGESEDIGQGVDLVLGLEEWE